MLVDGERLKEYLCVTNEMEKGKCREAHETLMKYEILDGIESCEIKTKEVEKMADWKEAFEGKNTVEYEQKKKKEGIETIWTVVFVLNTQKIRVNSVRQKEEGNVWEYKNDTYVDLTVADMNWILNKAKELFKERFYEKAKKKD